MKDLDFARTVCGPCLRWSEGYCALCEDRLEVAVHGCQHRKVPRIMIDGWAEAYLVAATCSPQLKLLGDHLVGLGLLDSMSNPTICRALNKHSKTLAGGTVVPVTLGNPAFVFGDG